MIARLRIDYRVLAAAAGKIVGAVLPEGRKHANGSGIVAVLQEIAQPFPLGAAVRRVFGIVNIDLQLQGEKIREARVGKVEHEPRTTNEVNEVIYKAQVDGSY